MIFRVGFRGEMIVTEKDFQRFLAAIGALSEGQLDALAAAIGARSKATTAVASADTEPTAPAEHHPTSDIAPIADIEARFAVEPACPHCRSKAVTKWGSASGLRRYRCKPCKVTFNALTP